MTAKQLDDSENTPQGEAEQEGGRRLLSFWVDTATAAEITEGLRAFFESSNAAESMRLVLKGFVRTKAMRDALRGNMAVALIGPTGSKR